MIPLAERPVLDRALAKDPRKRHKSCTDFVRELLESAYAPPPPPPKPTRSGRYLLLLVLFGLGLLLGMLLLTYLTRKPW